MSRGIPNVTYLLGAGASAHALPVINELPSRLSLFKSLIEQRCRYPNELDLYIEKFKPDIERFALLLISDIEWVLEELMSHSTIDTLAKRLYLISSRHDDLIKLKKVLYIYFLFEQGYNDSDIRKGIRKEVPDKRYDSLIATYISPIIDKLEIPGNIKIVTWNYDIQFDIAFAKYLVDGSLDKVQEILQVLPSLSGQTNPFEYEKFAIIHLNGIINGLFEWQITNDFHIDLDDTDFLKNIFLSKLCVSYKQLQKENLSYLTYSWEDPEIFPNTIREKNNLKAISAEIFKKTDILVVIGYSFPIFNRSVDKELMGNLRHNVKQIYIQDTKENVEDVKNIFINSFSEEIGLVKGQLSNIISTVNYTNQFHIPPEMNL